MQNRISNLIKLFSTPVWSGMLNDYKDLNKILLDYINELKKKSPQGFKKSNNLGWHSNNFNLGDDVPKKFLDKAKPMIKESIDDMKWDLEFLTSRITNMWSIINPKNSSNLRHTHPNSFLSSAYYIKAPKNCGHLILHDPRSAPTYKTAKTTKVSELNNDEYSITPQEGLLVLFPSYLHHSVGMNESDEDRIVLSFNIDLIYKK